MVSYFQTVLHILVQKNVNLNAHWKNHMFNPAIKLITCLSWIQSLNFVSALNLPAATLNQLLCCLIKQTSIISDLFNKLVNLTFVTRHFQRSILKI